MSHSHLAHMLISTQVHTSDRSGLHSYTHLFEQWKTSSNNTHKSCCIASHVYQFALCTGGLESQQVCYIHSWLFYIQNL